MRMHLPISLGVVIVATLIPSSLAQDYTCDNTPEKNKVVCECTEEICYFRLVIEHLQTFTAYEEDAARGTRGRVYYIDDNGQLVTAIEGRANCKDLSTCTEVHTVDGYTYRLFIAVNKQLPSPTLIVIEGATVVVDVVN